MQILYRDNDKNDRTFLNEIKNNSSNVSSLDDVIEYTSENTNKKYNIPIKYLDEYYIKSNGIKIEDKYDLLTRMCENGIILTKRNIKECYQSMHKDKVNKFLKNYKYQGELKAKFIFTEKTKNRLIEYFINDKHFHSRVPKIIDGMSAIADNYKISTFHIYKRFSIPKVSKFLASGLSEMETTLLVTILDDSKLDNLLNHIDYAPMIAKLLDKGYQKHEYNYVNTATWICTHFQTDDKFLNKIYKNSEYLSITSDTTIDNIKAQLSKIKSLSEKDKVEKAYKECGFKFKECKCNLQFTTSEYDKYRCEILKADDTRAFTIGYDTNCCQVLGDAGESAMMHGLINPKAGFWILTNKNTDKVLAQAEVWEEDDNTLVFDNIEFTNDADISLYKSAIGKWLSESSYPTIKMGTGWNEMDDGTFRECGPVYPTITAYEAYVLSYEKDAEAPEFYERTAPNKREDDKLLELDSVETAQKLLNEGRIDYYDYVYCDSENEAVYMKENGKVEPFFAIETPILNNDEEELEL